MIPDLESYDMLRSKLFAAGLLASCLCPAAMNAADKVEYVKKDGREYMITERVVHKPMSKTEYKEVAREVYREEYVTDTHDVTRLVQVPVTEYRWETHWANRWNPFSQPYLVQRLVPCTRLETRTEIVKLPVTQKRLVPETHISKVPETVRWLEPETTRIEVAIDPPAGRDVSSIAARPDIGGKKLEGDPPRNGTIIKRY